MVEEKEILDITSKIYTEMSMMCEKKFRETTGIQNHKVFDINVFCKDKEIFEVMHTNLINFAESYCFRNFSKWKTFTWRKSIRKNEKYIWTCRSVNRTSEEYYIYVDINIYNEEERKGKKGEYFYLESKKDKYIFLQEIEDEFPDNLREETIVRFRKARKEMYGKYDSCLSEEDVEEMIDEEI